MPEDLLKFGLIPEFVGRLPVIVTLTALTAADLVRVLTEPKNAIARQFQKFLSLDKVELVFTPGALQAAADVALDRKTGARALRSIVEEALLEVMYDIPERADVRKCIITEETIRSGRLPLLLTKTEVDKGVDETNYEDWLADQGATGLTARASAVSAGARSAGRPFGAGAAGPAVRSGGAGGPRAGDASGGPLDGDGPSRSTVPSAVSDERDEDVDELRVELDRRAGAGARRAACRGASPALYGRSEIIAS